MALFRELAGMAGRGTRRMLEVQKKAVGVSNHPACQQLACVAASCAPAFQATCLPDVLAGLGSSLHLPLKSFLPRCSATIAVIPITPITRKIAKKTIAITRTGILHL